MKEKLILVHVLQKKLRLYENNFSSVHRKLLDRDSIQYKIVFQNGILYLLPLFGCSKESQ